MRNVLVGVLCVAAVCLQAAPAGLRADLSGIQKWAIQLQGADFQEIIDSDYDLVVIDYSSDGTANGEYSAAQIQSLQDAGKTVLAYIPIGEASDFRFYWQSNWKTGNPSFIGPANPNWPGAYRAKYWKKSWWDQVIRPYLDRILDAGFDGVWMDGIDSYWFWYTEGHNLQRRSDNMCKLVRRIANHARDRAGDDFILCPNNGPGLINEASTKWRNRYLADIDAVGHESLYYNVWSAADQAWRLWLLGQFDAAGVRILDIEYIAPESYVEFFDQVADSGLDMLGYPAAPDRALDELIDYE